MTIETKYNIGDEVWFEWDGERVLAPIIDIHVHCSVGKLEIMYYVDYYSSKYPLVPIPEEYLFYTKEELLKSL